MSNDSLLNIQLDEYRLETMLGQGGMARVYRGIDTKLQRYVAIKVIESQFRSDEEYTRRFEREAQAIARLHHPNIVTLYRYGNVDGLLYMAMQYIKGTDLSELLAQYKADNEFMAPEEVLRIIRDVGRGLDYVHQQGTIHRDIKPSNIMLTEDGTAVIADFGLALMSDVGTRGEILGTPRYLSPEQAVSSSKVVPQSDIYALGIILYEMFTHRLPFELGEPLDIALAHVNKKPPAPSTYRRNLPASIEHVILKAIEKSPQQRYQTCKGLADALEAAIEQSGRAGQAKVSPHSIVERVHLDLEANPLPPLPPPMTPPLARDGKAEPSLFERMTTQDMDAAQTEVAAQESSVLARAKDRAMRWVVATGFLAALTVIALVLWLSSGRSSGSPADMTATAIDVSNRAVALLLTQTVAAFASADATQQANFIQEGQATSSAIANQRATTAAQNEASTLAAQVTDTPLPTDSPTNTALPQPTVTVPPTQQPTNTVAPPQQATNTAVPQATNTVTVIQQPTLSIAQIQVSTAAAQIEATNAALTQQPAQLVPTTIPTPLPPGETVVIVIYTNGDSALRIVRPAGQLVSTPLEIAALRLIRTEDDTRLQDNDANNDPDNVRELYGANWTTIPPRMLSGECIDILKSSNETPVGSVNCTDQGDYVTVNEENKTWENQYNVYYNNRFVTTCEANQPCIVQLLIGG
jgi:serine/threonine protein kinase